MRILKEKLQQNTLQSQTDVSKRVFYPVVIISQGLGNLADRNYYTAEAINSGVSVYEGKKAYYDHPTPNEDEQQPGRSVQDTCGHYENCRVEIDKDGLAILKADLVPEAASDVMVKLEHAIAYKKKYPDKDYIGISINGDGEGKTMEFDEFVETYKPLPIEMDKLNEIKGQTINAITKFTDAVSADLVTEAGARGRLLLESKTKRRKNMLIQAFQKLFKGLENNDKNLLEDAVKGMLQDGEGKEDSEAKEADEKESKAAEGMVKALLAAKESLKQEDGEAKEAYEMRVMKQAMKQMKASKEADEKPEDKKDEKPEDKKADESKDKKDEEKDEEKDKKEAADKKSDDKDDKSLITKMMKQMDEMGSRMEKMEASFGKKEDEAKESKENAATLKIKLAVKERNEFIDGVLAKSGMRREITNEIRAVLEKCKTNDEIKATAKRMTEAYSKVIESEFYRHNNTGVLEISTNSSSSNNDDLFN